LDNFLKSQVQKAEMQRKVIDCWSLR
jgi:hypothetical protein